MRLPDWPERLADILKASRDREFDDVNYCVVFAADCVQAMTGEDPMTEYRGLNMQQAHDKVKADGHQSFYHYLIKHYKKVPLSLAQRGDIIIRTEPETAAGICCGQDTAFASDLGIAYHPTLQQRWCFRVP